MDYRVLFSQRALNDVSVIVGHLARDDDEAASRFGETLLDHVDLLGRFPRIGNIIRKRSRVRKLVHSPIIVYHEINDDKRLVEVLHFRHGSRKPPRL